MASGTHEPSPNVQYVLSGQPTGWSAMAREVRDFDEDKVRDCKEDMDTLLVFAGLFSAVLSAFLVAAYPALQPDVSTMILYSLDRIATQTAGYNMSGGNLVATSSLPSIPPPFRPADNDIRVNVLWFASLIISLMTASFGMLVKQWLREFLAVEVPSPQARLRIRHFREPQIKHWKVYEFAACLPLLLQLSLGLFFVGLCYFTASVHSSIGYTTLPLVIGWALFFFTATALPIVFPHCPYKTTLLKAPISRLHHAFSQFGLRIWAAYSSRFFGDMGIMHPAWQLSLWTVLEPILLALQNIPDDRTLVAKPAADLDILVEVDAIQANDELLFTTIAEVLRGMHQLSWMHGVTFVLRVLENRLPSLPVAQRAVSAWPFGEVFPLNAARMQTVEGVLNVLDKYSDKLQRPYYEVFHNSDAPRPSQTEDRITLCAFALSISALDLLATPEKLPRGVASFLHFHLSHPQHGPALCGDMLLITNGTKTTSASNARIRDAAIQLRVLASLLAPLELDVAAGTACYQKIVLIAMESVITPEPMLLDPLALSEDVWARLDRVSRLFRHSCIEYLLTAVSEGLRQLPNRGHSASTAELIARLTVVAVRLLGRTVFSLRVPHLFRALVEIGLKSRSSVEVLLDAFLASGNERWWYQLIWYRLSRANASDAEPLDGGCIANLVDVVQTRLLRQPLDIPTTLKLSHIVVLLLISAKPDAEGRVAGRHLLSSLVSYLRSLMSDGTAIHKFDQSRPGIPNISAEVEKLATACLTTTTYQDYFFQESNYGLYEDWRNAFSEQNSLFPDEFMAVLGRFVPEDNSFFRLRRLKAITEKDGAVAIGGLGNGHALQ